MVHFKYNIYMLKLATNFFGQANFDILSSVICMLENHIFRFKVRRLRQKVYILFFL